MLKRIERCLLGLLVIGCLLNLIWPSQTTVLLATVSILVMVCGFHHLGMAFKWATGIFFVLGLLIAVISHFSLAETARAINSMDNLIVLLIVMQLFTVPITIGHYQRSIVTLVNGKLPTNRGLFVFTMLITFLLSSILSMGTVPIVYSVLGPTIKQRVGDDYQQYSSVAISRSFTLGTLWAPGAATIFLISTITHVSLQKLFVPSLILGILGLFLAYLMESRANYMQGQANQEMGDPSQAKHAIAQVIQIVIAVVVLLVFAFGLIHFKVGEAMIDVALAGIIVVGGWIALLQSQDNHQETIRAGRQYFQDGLLRGGGLAPFFVAIGLFSSAFERSPLAKIIGYTVGPLITHLSWGALILIPIIMVACSLIGIHPLASVTLLGQIMMGIQLPFSTLAVALGLNIGSVLSYMVSPFAGIVVVIANILGISSATVSLRWNGKYCISLLVLSLAFIIGYTLMVL